MIQKNQAILKTVPNSEFKDAVEYEVSVTIVRRFTVSNSAAEPLKVMLEHVDRAWNQIQHEIYGSVNELQISRESDEVQTSPQQSKGEI